MYLSRAQRNTIYEAIAGTGLDPAQCELKVTNAGFEIGHDSGSTFLAEPIIKGLTNRVAIKLALNKRRFILASNVIDGDYAVREVKLDLDNFIDDLQFSIADWAANVRRISELPDRWADIKRSETLIADIQGSQGAENTPFTQDEQAQIAAQLDRIRETLADRFELSRGQVEHIAERLDEAEQASKRMGRKDWLLLFGGSVLSLILTDVVTPGIAEHIFTVVIHGIAHMFTGASEPPQIPPRTLA